MNKQPTGIANARKASLELDAGNAQDSLLMKLSPVALAATAGFVWGAAILVIGTLNALAPPYGEPILALVVSIYPGYDATGELGDLLLGTGYALADGLVGGFVFAHFYNFVSRLVEKEGNEDSAETSS